MTTTTGTITVRPITIHGADIAQSPELMAEIEALHVEMPDASLEQILAKIVTKRIVDHLSAVAS